MDYLGDKRAREKQEAGIAGFHLNVQIEEEEAQAFILNRGVNRGDHRLQRIHSSILSNRRAGRVMQERVIDRQT